MQNRLGKDRTNFKLEILHATKEKNKKYNIIAEVDYNTFGAVIQEGMINVSFYRCRVFEFVSINRCYKCCNFNHKAKDCRNEVCCPKCAGSHAENECRNTKVQCSNCLKANEKYNLDLKVDHAVWARSCGCLVRMEKSIKNRMNYDRRQ